MATINRYRLFCQSDSKYEYVLGSSLDPPPTTCPVDTAHEIDATSVVIVEVFGAPSPVAADGRPIVVASQLQTALAPSWVGSDDNGVKMIWQSIVGGEASLDFAFSGGSVHVAGGGIMWQGGSIGDSISVVVEARPAVTATPGVGNCNIVGGLLVPDPGGAGTHTVDLGTCAPVPASAGHWDYDDPDTGLGTVTPNLGGTGNCHLYDSVQLVADFVRDFPLLGDGQFDANPQTLDRRIWPRWIWKGTVQGTIALDVALYVRIGRPQ